MELKKQDEPRTTPRYWGYRELSADELLTVGGGNENDGDGGDTGGGNAATGAENDNNNAEMAASIDLAFTDPVMAVTLTAIDLGLLADRLVETGVVGPPNQKTLIR